MIQLLSGLDATSSALDAERVRMDIVSENIANVQTTRGLDGKPYQRQQVVFENVLQQQQQGPGNPQTVRVARIERDPQALRWIYNPTHPDADAQGMVALPNINIHHEMVDLITASRTFEANLAVLKTARSLAIQTLAIGKHA